MGTTTKEQGQAESAAAANSTKANTEIENRVVRLFGVLEVAELQFTPGLEFGKAVIELRKEIKKNGTRNFMERLDELGIPYGKARYWMAIVDKKPINRGKAVPENSQEDTAEPQKESGAGVDWREDWPATTAKFREVASAALTLEQDQPDGREPFVGEVENLVVALGFEPLVGKGGDRA